MRSGSYWGTRCFHPEFAVVPNRCASVARAPTHGQTHRCEVPSPTGGLIYDDLGALFVAVHERRARAPWHTPLQTHPVWCNNKGHTDVPPFAHRCHLFVATAAAAIVVAAADAVWLAAATAAVTTAAAAAAHAASNRNREECNWA